MMTARNCQSVACPIFGVLRTNRKPKKQNDGCEGGNVFTAIHIQTRSKKKKWKLKKETFTTHIWIVA